MDENRNQTETDIFELIQKALHKTLDDRKGIEAGIHSEDHQWVAAKRKREEKIAKLCDKMTLFVMQWGVVGILGYAVSHLSEIFLWLSTFFKSKH